MSFWSNYREPDLYAVGTHMVYRWHSEAGMVEVCANGEFSPYHLTIQLPDGRAQEIAGHAEVVRIFNGNYRRLDSEFSPAFHQITAKHSLRAMVHEALERERATGLRK